MSFQRPMLHMLCGKVAAGKSTLSRKLADQPQHVIISEDDWLFSLFGPEMKTLGDYVRFSARLETVIGPHVIALLQSDLSVVMDFQANLPDRRQWLRGLATQANADHTLHFLETPDDLCLERLERRNASGTHHFEVSEAQYHQISSHFVPPSDAERLNIIHHEM